MKVLGRAKTPDGIDIQLEDWSEGNTEEFSDLYGLTIGAYPKAKRTGRYKLVREDEKFRLSISHNPYSGYTEGQVFADYEALRDGTKRLQDLAPHFWNEKKDMWYLGMDVERGDW